MTVTGDVECVCEGGWMRNEETGECHQHSTQAWCPDGQLLQEENSCNCIHYENCESFLQDATNLSPLQRSDPTQYQIGIQRLASTVCDQRQQHVCCSPDPILPGSLIVILNNQIISSCFS